METAPAPPVTAPTPDDLDDLLLACRYGDLADVESFAARFGPTALTSARDEGGNCLAHMAAANGHTGARLCPCAAEMIDPRKPRPAELLDFVLARAPGLAGAQNAAGSTPLHWAALNAQLASAHALVRAAGARLVDAKNAAGRSPLGEAELAGWDEGAKWMVEVMALEAAPPGDAEGADADETAVGAQIEVEIEDADGGIARMTIGGAAGPPMHEDAPPSEGTPSNGSAPEAKAAS
jgi:hypothetical protein